MREFGFQRLLEALRAEIASYLGANPNDLNGTLLDFYMDIPFSNYLNRMSIDGTLGDQITLRAAAELFNIKFTIISILSRAAEATMTQQNFASQELHKTLHRKVAFIWDTLRRFKGNTKLFLIQLRIPISLMSLLILK